MTGPRILMQRREHVFEVKYATLHWFRSYLLERFQFIYGNDALYPTKVYHTSLLQLDVDTIFDLLQNSLSKCFLTACNKFQCYTDGTKSYLSIKHSNKPQGCLKDSLGLLNDVKFSASQSGQN